MLVSSTQGRVIDYAPCKYNGSRLSFRGPMRALRQPYIACLGGCDVYGRFVKTPFADLLQTDLDQTVVNLAVEHAGLDAYLHDPGALSTAARARVVVLQITGQQNGSNRFYAVHPRRNDRFLKASPALIALYPEVDFTEVHFTGHLLDKLRGLCEERFAVIVDELRDAWVARMRGFLGRMQGQVVLFWFAPTAMGEEAEATHPGKAALAQFAPHVHSIRECVPHAWANGKEVDDTSRLDAICAERLPGAQAHAAAAQNLRQCVLPMIA